MTKKKPSRNISSLTDRIDRIEAKLGSNAVLFAHNIADGLPKTRSFLMAYGYRSGAGLARNVAKTAALVVLLKEETSQYICEQLNMNKVERLEHILETSLIARHKYQATGEAAHGAVYLKAMSIINTMTGDNAPTEIHHMIEVTAEQLEQMTNSQRTESYKRMMSGKLQLIESEVIEGEVIHSQ